MRATLGFDVDERRDCPTWTEALRRFIDLADRTGVLVMVSGVVLNNNRRRLDPEEFRGFALADDKAPLVFINGADSKAAQMFTLAHELAHVWLRISALSDSSPASIPASTPNNAVETWCNQVAAELLVPLETFRAELVAGEPLQDSLNRHARRFKVSTLVILKLLESETLKQQAVSNTKEQFANSPDLKTELVNAIMGALDAHTSMSTQALNSPAVQNGMKNILLNHSQLWETLRQRAAG